MVNWLNYKYLIALFTSLLLFSWSDGEKGNRKVSHWGFYGHKRINRMAVFTLPPQMFGFYKEHLEYVTENSVNPDKRRYAVEGEAQRHYIDLDHFYKPGEDPTDVIPKRWEDAVAKYTEDTLQAYGIVPWHIVTMKYRLQKAFEARDIDKILRYSADIGHYVGDAHVPLHTTENYNGQLTNQKGIHGLWESRLVEINADDYDYFVGKAKYMERPLDFAWETVMDSHASLDSVFRIERELTQEFDSDKKFSYEQRGGVTTKVYSYEFSQAYHSRMNGMVERRMRKAIISVGSIWYTAWVDAGQPDLDKLRGKPVSVELLKELEELEHHHEAGKSKGRVCD
jgi:hypothetical protein